ncbi:hypothetical protein TSUD_330600 [Trifolium subterraneum]|nr:hypothetical protein TSUD_330600 [Trifolium subterraneum]
MFFHVTSNSGLKDLKSLFTRYAFESGQAVNASKSTIFVGSITPRRIDLIVNLLNFSVGSLPFNYLGVPIFKGKPKASYLQPIADKIKLKLSAWKASLLSIVGRVQLVRTIVQSMLIYSISIYSWPDSLLKNIEKCMRNFIWSGDIDKRKLVTTSWKQVCQPFAQGGLNLRSLSMLNKTTNLKLCGTVLNSQDTWAKLLKARVLRNKRPIQHHIFSSLWSSIKEDFGIVIENSIWSVGNGLDINFWNDSWCGTPLVDLFGIPSHIRPLLVSTVSDYLLNGQWNIPPQLAQAFPSLCNVVNQVTIPLDQSEDRLIWKHTDSGDLLLKDAYHFKLQHFQELHWTKIIWNQDIPPSKSLLVWRIMHNRIPTDENLFIRGCYMPSMCSISSTSLTGSNTSKASSNSIRDFSFLKYFKIEIHQPKQTYLREVCWQPPGADWLKCNIDGASNGNPGLSSCGGIFRNSSSDFVYGFAEHLGVATSFYAELCGAMRAIDLAFQFHWHNVWLETDSVLVVSAFNKPTALVPWQPFGQSGS